MIFYLNPPGCGTLFLLRAAAGACKKQTAFLLRLANFPSGGRCPLVKIGALRQRLRRRPHTGALYRELLLLGLRCGVTFH